MDEGTCITTGNKDRKWENIVKSRKPLKAMITHILKRHSRDIETLNISVESILFPL